MWLNSDYIDPAELTGYARAGLADLQVNQFTLSQWLPNREVDDLEYRFARGGEGLIDAATYRAYDAESPLGSRPGIARVTGELPPISRKIRLGEYERLRQRKLQAAVGDALMSDAERMVRSVAARLELARGDALVNGSVTIDENGVIAEADYGRDSGNTTTPAGDKWDATAVDAAPVPLSDLLDWMDAYVTLNGSEPGSILTSRQVVSVLLRSAEVRNLAGTVNGVPNIVSRTTLDAVLQAHGLPPIYTYDAQVNVDGTATRPVPANRLLMLPAPGSSDLGAVVYGTTAESMEPEYGLAGSEAGIVSGVYSTKDPVALWTKAAAIAIPVLANPNLSLSATVLS